VRGGARSRPLLRKRSWTAAGQKITHAPTACKLATPMYSAFPCLVPSSDKEGVRASPATGTHCQRVKGLIFFISDHGDLLRAPTGSGNRTLSKELRTLMSESIRSVLLAGVDLLREKNNTD